MLAMRALFFAILLPGTTLVLIPTLLLRREAAAGDFAFRPLRLQGLILLVIGGAALFWCIRDFAGVEYRKCNGEGSQLKAHNPAGKRAQALARPRRAFEQMVERRGSRRL